MSLAIDLDAGPPATRRSRCSIGLLLNDLDEAEACALQSALDDHHWTGMALADVLKRNGHPTTGQTVNRHRAGRCQCSPTS